MTVRDLLTATLKLINVVAKSETPSPDELQDAYTRLNDMIDSWKTDSLAVYEIKRATYALTSGTQTYSIGTGGAFSQARPLWIQAAGIVSTNVSPSFELPVRVLTVDEYANLSVKTESSSLSWLLYYKPSFPLGEIFLWPKPNVTYLQLALYYPSVVDEFATVDTTISLPPGYREAIRYNLAVRLCPEFGRPVDPVVFSMAEKLLGDIRRVNIPIENLGMDSMLVGGSQRRVFNWLTGEDVG